MTLTRRPLLRDLAAIIVVGIFLFPLFWWVLTSFKSPAAIFSPEGPLFFRFEPVLSNYAMAGGGYGPDGLDMQAAFRDSVAVALGSTLIAMGCGIAAAYALSRMIVPRGRSFLMALLFLRVTPPIAIVIPAFVMLNDLALFNTRTGLMLMHAMLALPVAALMLKSLMDDVPREVDDAARIDGASSWQILTRVILPGIRGGLMATALLCFLFSWTEFMMSLFLTVSFRTLPVVMSVLSAGQWGPLAALGTLALLPSFIFILIGQRYLVRGMTMGLEK
jgi:multiple sugar transport system permease protein